MSTINEIALLSPIACVNHASHLRLYILGVDGSVRECQYEGGWLGGKAQNTIGSVKLTSPLAATTIGQFGLIRVYGIAANNTISEFCYDSGKGWYNGGLTGLFKVAPYSGVAAVFLANQPKLRVYCQAEDNTIQEYSYDNDSKGWYKDQNLGAALPGTSIAATSWGKTDSEIGIRVYFQDPNGKVVELAHDANSTWYHGALTFESSAPRTPLGVVSWDGSAHIRVYYGTADGRVREKGYDGASWYDGGFNQATVPASRVCALSVGGSNLRVYCQKGAQVTGFSELCFGSDGWVAGASPLPPS